MTGPAALLDAVRAAGATIRPRLWVEPLDRLDPELRAALGSREAEVIVLLAAAAVAPEPRSHSRGRACRGRRRAALAGAGHRGAGAARRAAPRDGGRLPGRSPAPPAVMV